MPRALSPTRPLPRARRRRRRSGPATFTWRPMAFLGSNVSRPDGRELFLHVAGGGNKWLALAFEGPRGDDPIAVLGDHAHRLLGEFANPAAAQRAGEGFARRWLRGTKIDACGCGDVDEGAP